MKITVEFNSLEEINEFAAKIWVGGTTETKAAEPVKETKKKETKKVKVEPKQVENVSDMIESAADVITETKYSFTDVRGALANLAKTNSAKVAAILKEFGASKLSEIKEEDYASVMERAGA